MLVSPIALFGQDSIPVLPETYVAEWLSFSGKPEAKDITTRIQNIYGAEVIQATQYRDFENGFVPITFIYAKPNTINSAQEHKKIRDLYGDKSDLFVRSVEGGIAYLVGFGPDSSTYAVTSSALDLGYDLMVLMKFDDSLQNAKSKDYTYYRKVKGENIQAQLDLMVDTSIQFNAFFRNYITKNNADVGNQASVILTEPVPTVDSLAVSVVTGESIAGSEDEDISLSEQPSSRSFIAILAFVFFVLFSVALVVIRFLRKKRIFRPTSEPTGQP